MRPPLRRTVRLDQGDDATCAINALIRWFVEDGYRRISIGRMISRENNIYVTVSGIK